MARFLDSPAAGEALLDEYDELTARLQDARRRAKAMSQCHPDETERAAASAAEQALDRTATEISLDARIYERLAAVDVSGFDAPTRHAYMWSLVIARDLLTGFDPADLLARAPAARYRDTVLAAGGSAPAAGLVREFLGRDYTFDAYAAWLNT